MPWTLDVEGVGWWLPKRSKKQPPRALKHLRQLLTRDLMMDWIQAQDA